ncbi:heparan sulfate glucosamine 3-O-sulfotransferase 1-like [Diadema antillarum]|uniref:heparan sulfate glucosamine 3-O-sulfotransferase 1-like n=1 Tax=Diadema antillarum TaxID=105358 RepID=UPI003A88A198
MTSGRKILTISFLFIFVLLLLGSDYASAPWREIVHKLTEKERRISQEHFSITAAELARRHDRNELHEEISEATLRATNDVDRRNPPRMRSEGHDEDSRKILPPDTNNGVDRNFSRMRAVGQNHIADAVAEERGKDGQARFFPYIPCHSASKELQEELQCKKRLPRLIVIGAKKGGTGALMFFLGHHPAIKRTTPDELHYWDLNQDQGIDWYHNKMPVTSRYQLTVEKSPAYFVGDGIPAAVARDLSPSIKLLLILRDPVVRAVSDYLETVDHFPDTLHRNSTTGGNFPHYPHHNYTYIIEDTFERSVLDKEGRVNAANALVITGMYSVHLEEWYKVFSRQQILIVDGDEFSRDPLPHLKDIETFLNIPSFFTRDLLYYDEEKGFYGLVNSKQKTLGANKGRAHPDVSANVLQKLRSFYRPYDERLRNLTGRTFSWMVQSDP